MPEIRILIIEDDNDINELLATYFKQAGYRVTQAYSGTEGLRCLESQPDLILLDLMLPGLSGEELLPQLREHSWAPVIVISGKAGIDDKVNVLRLGADDYMTKPFVKREVMARAEAQLRRRALGDRNASADRILSYRNLRLDPTRYIVFWNDAVIDLTRTEFDILDALMREPGVAFSRDRLYRLIWNTSFTGDDNAINVHMSHLRRKLKEASGEELIITVWGIGYRLA